MIDASCVRGLIETYKQHGWILRRVLLSSDTNNSLADNKSGLFENVPIIDSDIDAAWFSRPPTAGGVAWEIRYLGNIPFALLDRVDENDPQFESILNSVESRLRDAIAAKQAA